MQEWRSASAAGSRFPVNQAGMGDAVSEGVSARLSGLLRILLFGPWVLWRKTFPDRSVQITLRQRLLGIIFLAAVVIYLLAPGVVTAGAAAGLGGILAWGLIWARQMALHVSAQRLLRYHAVQVGDELEEAIHLTNQSAAEVLWAEIVDHSDLPGYSMASVRAVGGHQVINWRARTICQVRGVFQLGPWELLLGDPFGVFRVTQSYFERHEVLVYPPLADLPERVLPHQRSLGDRLPLRQPLPAETIQAITTRPFSPGDPLRHIHWRTSARKGMLFSKQFEPEAASRIWLIPDFDAGAHLTLDGESTLETTVTLAATLAALLLNDHLAVGLAAYASDQRIIHPQHNTAQLWPLLLGLAPLKAVFDQPLYQTLEQVRPLILPRDLVVVITPSTAPDWPARLRKLSGSAQGSTASAFLIDPESFGSRQSSSLLAPLLAGLGIQAQVIRRGDLKIRPAAYGPLSRWEFKTLGTGRVIVSHAPIFAQATTAGELKQ